MSKITEIVNSIITKVNSKVSKTSNETIAGVKTFSSSPIVPTPTTNMQVSTKKYVDDGLATKQGTLTSGTDIKTINNNSLLGSGDIVITETAWSANDSRAKTALNATGEAPIYACRAWVNFNGTGTVAIRASGNVSSITDNGLGSYAVKFSVPMPDANYITIGNCRMPDSYPNVNAVVPYAGGTYSTTAVSIYTAYANSSAQTLADFSEAYVSIFR